VDVDARDAKGRTALHLAALSGKAHLARLLRANGADPKIKDRRGRTALNFAEKRNDLNMQEALLC
jgi:ankyrin repeat protein